MSVEEIRSSMPDSGLAEYCRELAAARDLKPTMLLVQMPQFIFESLSLEAVKNRSYYAFPPVGLLWLKQVAEKMGVRTEIFDLNLALLKRLERDEDFRLEDWLSIIDQELARVEPSIVGVTCLTVYADLFDPPHPLTMLLSHLMAGNEYVVMAGGPTANNEIERYVSGGYCHFLFEGEGEDRLRHVLDLLFGDGDKTAPKAGVHYPRGGRAVRSTGDEGPPPLKGDLIREYDAIRLEEYPGVGCLNPYSRMAGVNKIYGTFQLVRGCRCNCKFCGVRSFMDRGVRVRDVADVALEMRYLAKERGVRHFEVLDDDFLADPGAVKALLREMVGLREEYGVTWAANNGMMSMSLDREILALMRDSGCLGFKIGIESGDPDMLRRIRKPGTVRGFLRVAKMLRDFPELFVGGNYIIGLFGEETLGQMIGTFRLSLDMRLDWSSFTVFQFTSKPNARSENLKTDANAATDFIPTKDSSKRGAPDDRSLPSGLDIFDLDPAMVPTRALVKNIWLAFNLLGNYIGNKNLDAGGDPGQFVDWLAAVHLAYPQNPYMALFLGLGRTLLGDDALAGAHYARAREIVDAAQSWRERFGLYGLDAPLDNPPRTMRQARQVIDDLRGPFLQRLKTGRAGQ